MRAPSASWFPRPTRGLPPTLPPFPFNGPLSFSSTLLHARVTRRRFRRVTFNERRRGFREAGRRKKDEQEQKERESIGKDERKREKERKGGRGKESLYGQGWITRGGITPVEELLMSQPKTPFFGHSFSSIRPTLWLLSYFFFIV